MSRLVIVTATTNLPRARACITSWGIVPKILVLNGQPAGGDPSTVGHVTALTCAGYLGTVAAFRTGVDYALNHTDAEVIACLHDDFQIQESEWEAKVLRHFDRQPACGLLGFGGAVGLGREDLYRIPYDPMSLARSGFRSNLVDAEAHGMRSLYPERVACLDGFSQIGRRAFWEGRIWPGANVVLQPRPWSYLQEIGIVHHFYDGALGCLARRYGWETWYLPLQARHWGGQTAVGDPGYQAWAAGQIAGGDHGFWEQAHKAGYEAFRDLLPLRV